MVAPKVIPRGQATYTADYTVSSIDRSREDLARMLALCPFIQGRLVSVRFVAGTRKVVRHGLGVAAACIVVRMNYDPAEAGPAFAEDSDQSTGVDKTKQLALVASTACDCDLWFYARASLPIDAGQGQSL